MSILQTIILPIIQSRTTMPFAVKEQNDAVIIEITGKFLGSVEGPAFKEALDDLKEAGQTHVIVDLSKTDMLDSSGIGSLISGLTTMRRAGGDIRLAGLEKRVKSVFLITRLLGPVFDDYETVEDARESYRTNPPEKVEA